MQYIDILIHLLNILIYEYFYNVLNQPNPTLACDFAKIAQTEKPEVTKDQFTKN